MNACIKIEPADLDELGLFVLLLADTGIPFKVIPGWRSSPKQGESVDDKPKVGGELKRRKRRGRPARKLTYELAKEMIIYMDKHPTETFTTVGKAFGYSYSVVRKVRDGNHPVLVKAKPDMGDLF